MRQSATLPFSGATLNSVACADRAKPTHSDIKELYHTNGRIASNPNAISKIAPPTSLEPPVSASWRSFAMSLLYRSTVSKTLRGPTNLLTPGGKFCPSGCRILFESRRIILLRNLPTTWILACLCQGLPSLMEGIWPVLLACGLFLTLGASTNPAGGPAVR